MTTESWDPFSDAIPVSLRPDPLPLSDAQRRLWILEQVENCSGAYNLALATRLEGPLDVGALEQAFADVVTRHESLRTVFAVQDGEPAQVILAPEEASVPFSLADCPETAVDGAVADAVHAPFDLAGETPLRVTVLRCGPDRHVLVITFHHIAFDGLSRGPFTGDLATAYAARRAGRAPVHPPLPVQYADWALWRRTTLEDTGDELLSRRRKALDGLPAELALPADRPRPRRPSHRGATVDFTVDAATHARLTAVAHERGATLFMAVQAALAGLLDRLGAGHDVPLGTAVADRAHEDLDGLVGFFVNTLVLRTDTSGDPDLATLIERAVSASLAAYETQELPFERLVDALRPERSAARHPLFQVFLGVNGAREPEVCLEGLTCTPLPVEVRASMFDLAFHLAEHRTTTGAPGGLTGRLDYDTDLFDEHTARGTAERLVRLLETTAHAPGTRLRSVDLLSADEHRVLRQRNATERPPATGPILACFTGVARTDPGRTAVVSGDDTDVTTYGELADRVNRLAGLLRDAGAGPGSFVGLALGRSADLLAAPLAVLSTGAAYLPLDPAQPAQRLRFLLEDARPQVLLTDLATAELLPGIDVPRIVLDAPATCERLAAAPSSPPPVIPFLGADLPAYQMYTSGSSGTPKGVVVTRGNLANLLADLRRRFPLDADDRVLAVTSPVFDISVLELFLPASSGAAVVLAPRPVVRDPLRLARLAERQGVTLAQGTPSLWAAVVEAAPDRLDGLRLVLGGEVLPRTLAERLHTAGVTVTNGYGPTEATVYATFAPFDPRRPGPPPIGRPLSNTRTYVLDAHLQPTPDGVPGELCVAGAGVAHGYRGRPGLTAERFVPDPLSPGERMYRTGDVVRWARDGQLEFLGRTDDQVKIRGQRVEPREVEAVLEGHEGVERAVVVPWRADAAPGGTRLAAYLLPAPAPGGGPGAGETERLAPGAAQLRAYVTERLPDAMVPAVFTVLDALPLTVNGKVDRAALPAPTTATAPGTGRPAADGREELLCALMSELLGVRAVGPDDNFFDLGGHSMSAVALGTRVRDVLGLELATATVFENPTAALLHARLADGSATGAPAVLTYRGNGDRAPLFLFPALNGLGWCYAGLVRHLPPGRRVHALQDRRLSQTGDIPAAGLRDLAAGFAQEVRGLCDDGPCALAGWSFGGTVAQETAVMLEKDGVEVERVALFDSFPRPVAADAARREDALAHGLDGVPVPLGPDGSLPGTDVVQSALRKAGSALATLDTALLARVIQVIDANASAFAAHTPRACRAPVVCVDAGRGRSGGPAPASGAWRTHLPGELRAVPVRVPHTELLSGRGLQEAGPVLAGAVDGVCPTNR